MSISARADGASSTAHQADAESAPTPLGGSDLALVAARRDISDRAFRVYTLTTAAFDGAQFTVQQASEVTGLTRQQVASALTELRNAGIYEHRKRIVAHQGERRIIRSLYRKVGEVSQS